MGSTYDIGDYVKVTGTFSDTGGVLGDPTTVNFLYDTPTSTAPSTATRPGSSTAGAEVDGITRLSSGVFIVEIEATGQGLYRYRYTSTGTLAASEESWFSIRPRYVST